MGLATGADRVSILVLVDSLLQLRKVIEAVRYELFGFNPCFGGLPFANGRYGEVARTDIAGIVSILVLVDSLLQRFHRYRR